MSLIYQYHYHRTSPIGCKYLVCFFVDTVMQTGAIQDHSMYALGGSAREYDGVRYPIYTQHNILHSHWRLA